MLANSAGVAIWKSDTRKLSTSVRRGVPTDDPDPSEQHGAADMSDQRNGTNMANAPAARGSAAGAGANELGSPVDGGTGQLGGGAMGPLGANAPGTAGGGMGGLAGAAAAGDAGPSLSQSGAAQTPAGWGRGKCPGGGARGPPAGLRGQHGGAA